MAVTTNAVTTQQKFLHENDKLNEIESNKMPLDDSNGNVEADDEVFSLESSTAAVDLDEKDGQHTRKRSVLKREDRPRNTSARQKRVSFSTSPSERRVSNGMLC